MSHLATGCGHPRRAEHLTKDKGDSVMLRIAAVVIAIVLASGRGVSAGLLSIPESYTPEKSWPVIVSLQDNPDPALTAKSPYFLVHAGGTGVECSSKIHNGLKDLAARFNIDLNRIYGTGFSRGGHELLEQTWHYPHLFAAIAPVCIDLRDLSLLTKFLEKRTFDPYPKEVTHVVVHPRSARGFWVDCRLVGSFLDKPPAPPDGKLVDIQKRAQYKPVAPK